MSIIFSSSVAADLSSYFLQLTGTGQDLRHGGKLPIPTFLRDDIRQAPQVDIAEACGDLQHVLRVAANPK